MLLLSTYRQGGIIMGECNRSHREDFWFKMQYLSNPKHNSEHFSICLFEAKRSRKNLTCKWMWFENQNLVLFFLKSKAKRTSNYTLIQGPTPKTTPWTSVIASRHEIWNCLINGFAIEILIPLFYVDLFSADVQKLPFWVISFLLDGVPEQNGRVSHHKYQLVSSSFD